jgi:hypothetical protein
LRVRFQAEIERNAFGSSLDIFVRKIHQGIFKRAELADDYICQSVVTIDCRTLLAQAGMPRYLKIDIEGNEVAFLQGMLREGSVPEFKSVECYTFRPVEMLQQLGYTRFKLVDQFAPGGFQLLIRSLLASVSMLIIASPHGASVTPRPVRAIPYQFAAHGQGKLHQH